MDEPAAPPLTSAAGAAAGPSGSTVGWSEIEAALDVLLDLPPDQQEARLAAMAAENEPLATALRRLLVIATQGDGLGRSRGELLSLLAGEELALRSRSGERVGAFRLTHELGRGGMGAVYAAERVEGGFGQRVAVKLVKRGLDSEEVLQRFLAERRILARLEHPRIARLVDGGLTAEGLPWFAMELVDGRAITDFAAEHALGERERFELLLEVCEAVAFAHARQVVHRDIKPANVLVDAAGRVKLLDFGIAKLLDADDPALTRTAARVMTPRYAAPEQLAGGEVSPRTDIWQLGKLIAELQALSPGRDVQRVVAKACHQDPALRYGSVDELAADLRRLLAGESVAAREPLGRRVRRLVLRRAAVGGAVAAVLVTIAVAWLARRQDSATPAASPVAPPSLRLELVSTFPGSHRQASFSPDAARIAFVAEDAAGRPQLWVKAVQGGAAVQLTQVRTAVDRPRWHPREDRIVYGVYGDGIWSVPAGGGEPARLLARGRNPALSADGRSLLVEDGESLLIAGLPAGSGPASLTGERLAIDGITFVSAQPSFAADGRGVLYVQHLSAPVDGDVWLWPRDGTAPRQLTHDDVPVRSPVALPGGGFLASSARGGGLTLWRFPPKGPPEQLTTGAGEDVDPEVSRDGRRVIYTNARQAHRLLFLDGQGGGQRTLLERRLTTTHPSFSPAADEVVFFARESDQRSTHLFTVRTDGTQLRQLTTDDRVVQTLPEWSPDGRIYYYEFDRRQGRAEYRRLSPLDGFAEVVLPGWRFPQAHGTHLDPTGRRIVYSRLAGSRLRSAVPGSPSRLTESRGVETVIRDLATGGERPLPAVLLWARWSPDGTRIAGGDESFAVQVCDGGGRVCRRVARGREPHWRGNDELFYRAELIEGDALGTMRQPAVELRAVRADGSGERHVADLQGPHPVDFFFDVSARGDVVWSSFAEAQQELWTAELPAAR